MNFTTTVVARHYRLQQWVTQIQKCQNHPSGMSISDLDKQQGITKANIITIFVSFKKLALKLFQKQNLTILFQLHKNFYQHK